MVQSNGDVCVVFDQPTDVRARKDGTDSLFEMMSNSSVSTIVAAMSELGFTEPDILSSYDLYIKIAENKAPQYRLAINLSSGLVDRWRYAQAPMALELLRLPYSGSDLFSILICRDKHRTKQLCSTVVNVPRGLVVAESEIERIDHIDPSMFPVIVKPNSEGGSVGLNPDTKPCVDTETARLVTIEILESYPEGVLIEQFIAGTEVTVVVLGNGINRKVYPFSFASKDKSALPKEFIRTQSEKADAFETGDRLWFNTAEIHGEEVNEKIYRSAKLAAETLGLLDLARLDFRVDTTGEVYFIEANAQPTFTPGNTSLTKCSELHFGDPLGVEKAYIEAALLRTQ